MLTMGFDAFDFDLKELSIFVQGDSGVGPCKHTLNLFEAAKASGSDLCSAERLPDRIQEVNEVYFHQKQASCAPSTASLYSSDPIGRPAANKKA